MARPLAERRSALRPAKRRSALCDVATEPPLMTARMPALATQPPRDILPRIAYRQFSVRR